MDHTVLYFGVGVNAFNGFGKALESVDAGDDDVFDASIVQVS